MIVAYSTLTGNVGRFVGNLGLESVQVKSGLVIDAPYVLITVSFGKGAVPKDVESFLSNETNIQNLKGVVGSGNINWKENFCGSAITIADRFKVPLLHKFEMSGYPSDVKVVRQRIKELEGMI